MMYSSLIAIERESLFFALLGLPGSNKQSIMNLRQRDMTLRVNRIRVRGNPLIT